VVKTKQERKIFIKCAWLAVYYFIVSVFTVVMYFRTLPEFHRLHTFECKTRHIGFARVWEEMTVVY
jgi:hypothetical protein